MNTTSAIRPAAGGPPQTIDYTAATSKQQATWATGDFHEIARGIMPVSEALCRAADPRPGERVLDVACGSGNTAMVAARRFCQVTGIDYVPALVERARERAAAESVSIDFHVADAQSLPFANESFDSVLSVFGVMFAPDQERAASELLRVCRPGGRIGLASWMPRDFGADFFGAHGRHVPPPAGVPSALRWGTEDGIRELLGGGAVGIISDVRSNRTFYRSIDHALEIFSRYFGPTRRALDILDPAGQAGLLEDLRIVFDRYDIGPGDSVVLETRYLETIAVRH